MSATGQGIDVGDAVLNFIGNTTQLDQTFASLPEKAQAGIAPINAELGNMDDGIKKVGDDAQEQLGERIPEAAKLSRQEMREARGEVRLLGEEFGIRLPRHVANFVAEMPGVGEALSAAFSATAVLFLIQALVEATKKVSDFAGAALIYTAAQKAQYALLVQENLEIAKQEDLAKKARAALTELTDTRTSMEKLGDALKANNAELEDLDFKRGKYARTTEAEDRAAYDRLTAENALIKEQGVILADNNAKDFNKKTLGELDKQIEQYKSLTSAVQNYEKAKSLAGSVGDPTKSFAIEQEFAEKEYQLEVTTIRKKLDAQKRFGADDLEATKELNQRLAELSLQRSARVQNDLNKEKEETLKILGTTEKAIEESKKAFEKEGGLKIVIPENVKALLDMQKAAKEVGVELRSHLVAALNEARIAKNLFVNTMGTNDVAQLKLFDKAIDDAAAKLHNLGKAEDQFKEHNDNTFKNLIAEWKNGTTAMVNLQKIGVQTFDQLTKGLENAVAGAILGQESFGKALEKATAQALAQLAAQALVKSLFYTAEGFAALAMFNYGGAAQFFTAAGEMAAVGAAAGISARALSGSGGGSNSTTQKQSSSVDTGGSTRSTIGVTGVQKFAEGGLITSPTMAIIGENPGSTEAVLPLDNRESMSRIGAGIAQHVVAAGGGGGMHVHVKGMVSPDNLSRVVGQINRRIGKGQMNLRASNSFRITKRSA